ncbi:MAG TPA: FAD-dependent oxidoreductase [Ruminococcaceae bacterium]|jgi:hypothetical protein|nr:FAD-dependent oxidoreductase [Oscillospiraceae bacterium]
MEIDTVRRQYDVVVAGGGVSGCAAAVAAARCGAKVLVVEESGYLGGTLTGCGVGPMMTFHAGEKQVIKGVMQEIVDGLVRRGYSPGHVKDTKQYVSYLTPFDPEGLKIVLDDMLTGAGCSLLFHTFICGVKCQNRKIESLLLANKDGLTAAAGQVFLDATGDGDVAAWSGAKMTKGRPEDGAAQPMSTMMKFCNVNTAALKDFVLDHPEKFPRLKPYLDLFRQPIPVDLEGFDEEFKAARASGELSIPRENLLLFGTGRPGEYIANTTRIIDHDATSARSLSDAELVGRRQCAELARFLRRNVPGFENALLEFTGPSVGIRGSRQLVGCYTLTARDILERRKFPSVIAHSAYPIDIHNPKGAGTDSTFLSAQSGISDSYYSIPYEVMVCPEVKNLLVSGRCVSATFEAQAAIRTTPTAGAIGQAAGVAAALAATGNADTRAVEVARVQQILKKQGAYLDI